MISEITIIVKIILPAWCDTVSSSRKYPYPPEGGLLEIKFITRGTVIEEEGCVSNNKIVKESMNQNWNSCHNFGKQCNPTWMQGNFR